jgi:hypothetical protein
METKSVKLKIAMFGMATMMAIFITRPAVSQETAKTESHKKIVMKIISDDNGKITVTDTTMVMTDSSMVDSIEQEMVKVVKIGKGGKHARVRYHNMPQAYNFDFDVPCPPDCQMDLDELEGFDPEEMSRVRDMEERLRDCRGFGSEWFNMQSHGKGQTLNDLLGEIPMDRVVSYSIKDRKNGKRIIIDLNDAPMFERQEKIVIIREPGSKK